MNIGTLNFKTKKEAYNYTKKIIYEFLENRYDIPTKFGKELITNKITLKDSIFKDEWIDFHNINTTYQILCKNCNLKKGKKNIHNKIPMSICLVSIE